jgi:serine/threonine protein kinase
VFNKYQNLTAWSAPEQWNSDGSKFDSPQVDSYSYGMLMWELETGKVPFEELTTEELKMKLLTERARPYIPDLVCSQLALLIRRCW